MPTLHQQTLYYEKKIPVYKILVSFFKKDIKIMIFLRFFVFRIRTVEKPADESGSATRLQLYSLTYLMEASEETVNGRERVIVQ